MVFSSQVFLFFFLPVTLLMYYIIKNRTYRNFVLMVMSLFFYWYGVRSFIIVIIVSIFMNWLFAWLMHLAEGKAGLRRFWMICSVVWDLSILFYYKYWNFAMENVNALMGNHIVLEQLIVPVGLSFVTFQSMSYCLDVFMGNSKAEKNPLMVALYICLFPQLVAGPIVKFHDVQEQLMDRHENFPQFNDGVVRFIYGLGKKVILANVLSNFVDDIYAMDPSTISAMTAWVAAIGYTLQIYFDFSGYSDMAIGMGKMFGIEFKENFNYPYCSKSISEFWRRWHISLGNWFREYVYIPLGGNRVKQGRMIFNLMVVWLLTGIWHGANWTFIMWGVSYGIIIVIEKLINFSKRSIPGAIKSFYTLFIVNLLWVYFRSDSIGAANVFIKTMFGGSGILTDGMGLFYIRDNAILLIGAIVISIGAVRKISEIESLEKLRNVIRPVLCMVILIIALSYIVKGSYNPFIYFNF